MGLFSVTSWAVSRVTGGILQLLKHRKSDECRGKSVGKEVSVTKLVSLLTCHRQRSAGQCWLLSPPPPAAEFRTAGRGTTEGGCSGWSPQPSSPAPALWLSHPGRVLDISSFTREPRAGRGSDLFVLGERERCQLRALLSSRGNS